MAEILINGWFWQRKDTGSGQYLHALLRHWPVDRDGRDLRPHLLIPAQVDLAEEADAYPCVSFIERPAQASASGVAKVWWEQHVVPATARRMGADLIWHPYWTAALRQPCPQIITVHDVIPAQLPAYRKSPRQRLYLQLVEAATRRAAHVLTVSQAAGKDIREQLGLPRERVSVVLNGMQDLPAPHPHTADRLRRRHRLPERFFLYLGSFERRKNVAGILQAYALYRRQGGDGSVMLVLAGRLPEANTLALEDPRPLIRDLELEPWVRVTGYVTEEEKAALYGMAAALVFPGLYEGFGLMVAEAMQAGLPVITSRR